MKKIFTLLAAGFVMLGQAQAQQVTITWPANLSNAATVSGDGAEYVTGSPVVLGSNLTNEGTASYNNVTGTKFQPKTALNSGTKVIGEEDWVHIPFTVQEGKQFQFTSITLKTAKLGTGDASYINTFIYEADKTSQKLEDQIKIARNNETEGYYNSLEYTAFPSFTKEQFTGTNELVLNLYGKMANNKQLWVADVVIEGVITDAGFVDPRTFAPISWNTDQTTLKLRDAFTAPVLVNDENLAVTYSATGAVATVDENGVITLVDGKTGTSEISASYAGDETTYKPTSVTTKITVNTNVKDVYLLADDMVTRDLTLDNFKKTEKATTAGEILVDDDYIKITSVSKANTADSKVTYFGNSFTKHLQVRTNTHPTSDNLTGDAYTSSASTALVLEPKQNMTFTLLQRRQTVETNSTTNDDVENNIITKTHYMGMAPNDGKSVYIANQNDVTTKLDQELVFGASMHSEHQYVAAASIVTLVAGQKYTVWSYQTTIGLHGFAYTVIDSENCTVPQGKLNNFSFEKKSYSATFTAIPGESLMVSVDGAAAQAMESPATVDFKATASAYAVTDGKADSEVVTVAAPATYDAEKPYIAWVYVPSYAAASRTGYSENALIQGLKTVGNVILVEGANSVAPSEDLNFADLIVSGEAMAGGDPLAKGMKNFVGNVNMINLKFFAYTSGRWSWGTPDNPGKTIASITVANPYFKVLDGVTFEADKTMKMYDGDITDNNHIQCANLTSAPEGNVNMGTVNGEAAKVAMHGFGNFFGIGLSCDDWEHYGANAVKVVTNAAKMMLEGKDVTEALEATSKPWAYGHEDGAEKTYSVGDEIILIHSDANEAIYYTLDGQDPVKANATTPAAAPAKVATATDVDHTGKTYVYDRVNNPIIFNGEPMTISYMAHADGMAPSEVMRLEVGEDGTTGIAAVAADNEAPAEYFNLQGIRVENPSNGIFILRQGNTVTKIKK